ncbi:hypothetical protein C8J56DRAFT_441919 [Mycena floridula]|nr:hypothetical protein C8J56DRAFT_441919 [Mycena floridula]
MPSFTIEDYSPLLNFQGAWTTGSSTTDDFLSSYSAASFLATTVLSSSMSFTFNGTGVQIFGAKRVNHGNYQVTVDGSVVSTATGQADPPIFQTALFSTNSLKQGQHTVTLQNAANSFVDVDYVTWETDIGQTGETPIVNTLDDSSSSFQYSPAAFWSATPENIGSFLGSTGHATSTPGAEFTVSFIGDGISLYGPVGPKSSGFSVQVDGGPVSDFTANKANFVPQVMLYHADNLGPGSHKLRVLYTPQNTGDVLAIDFASTYSTKSLGGVTQSFGAIGAASPGLSGGSIAGLVIGILISLALVAAGCYYLFILRRRRQASSQHVISLEKLESNPSYSEGYAAQPGRKYSVYNPSGPRPLSVVVPVPPISYQQSSPVTAPGSSSFAADDAYSRRSYGSSNYLASGSTTLSYSNSMSPRRTLSSATSTTTATTKGRIELPPTAGQSLSSIPDEELASQRMVKEGRPQDWGAVPVEQAQPPPDYDQATETFRPAR